MKLIIDSNFKLTDANMTFINEKSQKFMKELPDDKSNVLLTVKHNYDKFVVQLLYKDIIIVSEANDFHNCICEGTKKFLNQNRKLNRKLLAKKKRQYEDAEAEAIQKEKEECEVLLDEE